MCWVFNVLLNCLLLQGHLGPFCPLRIFVCRTIVHNIKVKHSQGRRLIQVQFLSTQNEPRQAFVGVYRIGLHIISQGLTIISSGQMKLLRPDEVLSYFVRTNQASLLIYIVNYGAATEFLYILKWAESPQMTWRQQRFNGTLNT